MLLYQIVVIFLRVRPRFLIFSLFTEPFAGLSFTGLSVFAWCRSLRFTFVGFPPE